MMCETQVPAARITRGKPNMHSRSEVAGGKENGASLLTCRLPWSRKMPHNLRAALQLPLLAQSSADGAELKGVSQLCPVPCGEPQHHLPADRPGQPHVPDPFQRCGNCPKGRGCRRSPGAASVPHIRPRSQPEEKEAGVSSVWGTLREGTGLRAAPGRATQTAAQGDHLAGEGWGLRVCLSQTISQLSGLDVSGVPMEGKCFQKL